MWIEKLRVGYSTDVDMINSVEPWDSHPMLAVQ